MKAIVAAQEPYLKSPVSGYFEKAPYFLSDLRELGPELQIRVVADSRMHIDKMSSFVGVD